MSTSRGRFAWFDLMTRDAQAATAFYCEVVGWRTQSWSGPMDYTMLCVGDDPIGGVMAMPAEVKEAPQHWLGYVEVADIEAAARQVSELGGMVHKSPEAIPDVGHFAVVADPNGAVFSLFQSANPSEPRAGSPRQGDVSWHELNTTDYEASWTFYSKLAGWKHTESFDMGPEMGTYFMWQSDGASPSMGGMSNMAKSHNLPPHWLFYFHVEDMASAVSRIESSGGTIINGPMEVPGGDTIVQAQDPQGGFFALHSNKK